MSMDKTIQIINQMERDGVIGRYAIGGAVAAYNYIEPTVTEDLDLLISFDDLATGGSSGLVTVAPIYAYLAAKGYSQFQREGLVVEGWSIQFLPVADGLDAEALVQAVDIDFQVYGNAVKTRVLRPEHVVATAVKVGRAKDFVRISQFLTEQAVDLDVLRDTLDRHGLKTKWSEFCTATGTPNPFEVRSEP